MNSYLGFIKLTAFNYDTDDGFMVCDGRLLSVSNYNPLFSLMGNAYGGDGISTFAIPDLRSRTAIGFGTGPGLAPIPFAQKGGIEDATITVANLPAHTHIFTMQIPVNNNSASTKSPVAAYPAATNSPNKAIYNAQATGLMAPMRSTVSIAGGSPYPDSIEVRNKFLGLSYLICTIGLFPPRP